MPCTSNRECSQDIPGRGEFYGYDEYVRKRLTVPAYSPAGVVVALEARAWVGMCAISDWHSKGFMFNEMTGVRSSHRRRGIGIAMKVLGIRRLGYVETDFEPLLSVRDDR